MYELATGEELTIISSDTFNDTDAPNIIKAYQLGVVNGYPDGSFRPDALISRQELITMFYRALVALDSSYSSGNYGELTFLDSSVIASFAIEASEFMVGEGLINGVGDNLLSPLGTATKQEAIKIVLGVYEHYWGLN
jgi:hypothetical protein